MKISFYSQIGIIQSELFITKSIPENKQYKSLKKIKFQLNTSIQLLSKIASLINKQFIILLIN